MTRTARPTSFLKDLDSGDLTRVSVGTDGQEADAGVSAPAVNGNGSMVAFASDSDSLTPGDGNGETDVFVRDTEAGTLTRISDGVTGRDVDISADGGTIGISTSDTTGVELDANVERVDIARALTDLDFQVDSAGLRVTADGTTVVRLPSLNQDVMLWFDGGSATLSQRDATTFELTGGAGGSAVIDGDGADPGAVSLGGASASPPDPPGTTPAANIFLNADRGFTVAEPANVFGRQGGRETVTLAPDATGVGLDANVEDIDVPRALSELTFDVTADGLRIRADGATLTTMPSLNQAATLDLDGGTATLEQTGADSFLLTPADGAAIEIGAEPVTPEADAVDAAAATTGTSDASADPMALA